VETEKCPACGSHLRWVLWRRERGAELWKPVTQGAEAEVRREFAAIPPAETRFAYTLTRPCENWPPVSWKSQAGTGLFMPPSPRNSPALTPTESRDTTRENIGWHRDESPTGWEMLFGDGEWHSVDVRAWWLDDRGRQVVQIEWFAELTTWGGTFLADIPGRMREG
jgi:hypothetical protein